MLETNFRPNREVVPWMLRTMFLRRQKLERLYPKLTLVGGQERSRAVEEKELRTILEKSVRALELQLVLASLSEALVLVAPKSLEDLEKDAARVRNVTSAISGLDAFAVFSTAPEFRELLSTLDAARVGVVLGQVLPYFADAFEQVVQSVRSFVAACPIERLEQVATTLGEAPIGHRCRTAYDRLQGFLVRNGPAKDARANTVGVAYADGRLKLDEVTTLLGLSRPDAVAWLEERGFARAVNKVGLEDTERALILARIDADRKARDGALAHSSDLVRRDVIASQRIEGVDARPWLQQAQEPTTKQATPSDTTRSKNSKG